MPTTATAPSARPYERSGVVRPATRIVPAIAVPNVDPRLDTLRDSPEISPCWSSGNADCTTFTDGVSMSPSPTPTRRRPGVNAHAVVDSGTSTRSSTTPAVVTTNPTTTSERWAY